MLARPVGFAGDADPFMTSFVTLRQNGCAGSQSFASQRSPIPSPSMSD